MKKKPISIPIFKALLPGILLGLLHVTFTYSGFYRDSGWGWIDIPLHLAGGACVSFAAILLLSEAIKRKKIPPLPTYFFILTVVGIVAIVGVAWEFYELLSDYFYPVILRQPSNADTMKDLADDLNGGFITVLILLKRFGNILSIQKTPPK